LARFLALDWDHKQVHLVSAKVGKGGVRIERALTWQDERSPNPADAESLGEQLRDRLKAENIAPAPLLVCVGRDRVIVKEVRHPVVPANEEPAVVRFQAVKELTDPADEVVIDYVSAGPPDAGQARSLVLVLRRELLGTYRTLCRTAGLKLEAITPRPFGVVSGLRDAMGKSPATPAPDPADAAVGVLTMTERWAEFCVLRGDRLVFARTVTPGASLAGELRRNLALYAGQSHQHPVRALYVAGGSDLARLQETLAIPVYPFDPLAGVSEAELPPAGRAGFAGAAGLLHVQAAAAGVPINFAHPKEPRPAKDPNQKRYVVAAAVAATILLLAVAACAVHLQMLDSDETALRVTQADLESQVQRLEEDKARHKAVEDWTRSDVCWLDELYDFTSLFPEPDSIRLKVFSGEPQDRSKTHQAQLQLTGVTTYDDKLMRRLTSELRKDPFYSVKVPDPGRNSEDRFQFPVEFKMKVEVKKRAPGEYKRTLPDPEPAADKGEKGGDQ
jgi:hypothetical protein